MLNRNKILGVATAGLLVLANGAVAEQKWDMPSAYAANNYVTQSYFAFAEEVKEKTDGELEIIVHPSGSLYKASEILRAVRTGQVPMGARYMGAHSEDDPIFGLDNLPFLATTKEQAWEMYQVSKPAIEKALEERGLKLVYMPVWPPQGLFSSKELTNPADLEGMKLRTYSSNTTKIATLLDAIPTKTEATELGQAFSTGIIEGSFGSGAIGVFRKLWDYLDYYYTVNAWLPKSAVIVNMDSWNSLNSETQNVVMEVAASAELAVWDAMSEANVSYNTTMSENGMFVGAPNAEVTAAFKDAGAKIAADWAAVAGEEGQAILDQLAN